MFSHRLSWLAFVVLVQTSGLAQSKAPPEPLNATGRWKLGSGLLLLKQDGNRIQGTYRNGQSTMEGTLRGRVWAGTFRYNASVHGTFEYTFSNDGMSFAGPWANATDSNKGTDKAKRLLDATGHWKLGSGTLVLKQEGTKITGTYRSGQSSMTGQLKDRVWTGTFRYNSSVHGTISYTFSKDFTRFSGPWANAADSKKGIDKGIRLE